MRDPDAIEPREAASLQARPPLEPEERPPDSVELTLSTITIPEGSEVELLQVAPGRFRVEARVPGARLGEVAPPPSVPARALSREEIDLRELARVPSAGFRSPSAAVTFVPRQTGSRRGPRPKGDVGIGGAVFAPDDRYLYRDTNFPWRIVGRVDTPGMWCTGTMVGRRLLLLAGHCIEWREDDTAGWVRFRPAYFDGLAPFGEAWATLVIYWRENDSWLTDDETAFDYVVCVLDRPLGDTLGFAGYRTYLDAWNGDPFWQHMGYPTDLSSGERPAFQSPASITTVEQFSFSGQTGYVLGNFNDTEHGHSGGPVWGWWGEEPWPRIVGVFSTLPEKPDADSTTGDNEHAGGPALSALIAWARSNFP
jgi:V8-like Glu-specific endopeptidase